MVYDKLDRFDFATNHEEHREEEAIKANLHRQGVRQGARQEVRRRHRRRQGTHRRRREDQVRQDLEG
eukprot:7344203-Karenia_brevis.AAC.1